MIKLTDCAMALSKYQHEYWLTKNQQLIPLRWIAPEALIVKHLFRRRKKNKI